MQEILTKKCSNSKCLQPIKPITEFYKDKHTKDKHYRWCKKCVKERHFQFSQTLEGKEYQQKAGKKWRKTNPQYNKEYHQHHKDKHNKYNREYYHAHPEKVHTKTYNNQYVNIRRQNDPKFKILTNLRSRMRSALKHNWKSTHTKILLGCTIEQWKQHLESLFTEGMSWNNYGNKVGQWSIDHIIPCDYFDLRFEEEQRICFHYLNTQPMWHVENLLKHNKIYC